MADGFAEPGDAVMERIALARLEPEEAGKAARITARLGVAPSTPDEDFGHVLVTVRAGIAKVSEWTLTEPIHTRFATFCTCTRNAKLAEAAQLFRSENHIGFTRYWNTLVKRNNVGQ